MILDIDYDDLDPGIREVVRRLNDAGFTTTDSGDGVSKLQDGWDPKEVLDFPHVYIAVEPEEMVSECIRLKALVESWGICVEPVGRSPVWIQVSFDPCDDSPPVIMLTGVSDKALK